MRFKIMAMVASAVLTAGIWATAPPAGAVSFTHRNPATSTHRGPATSTHRGPATLRQLARELSPLCNPCGPYAISLASPPNSNFVSIQGDGHNNPVLMAATGSRFWFYHAGTFHGVTTWQVQDQYSGLCLNAAIDGQTGIFEIYLDSCPSPAPPNEQFQLNARSAHYISNVGVSEYFNNGVQSGDLSADESDNFVDVLDNPGNHFWDQWVLT